MYTHKVRCVANSLYLQCLFDLLFLLVGHFQELSKGDPATVCLDLRPLTDLQREGGKGT